MESLSKNENQENNLNSSIMILTIDIGNGICDKLKIHNINKYEQETYDFCAKNNLDFNTMREINSQIQKVIQENKIFKNYSCIKREEQKTNIPTEEKRKKKNSYNRISEKKDLHKTKTSNKYRANPLSSATQRKKKFSKTTSHGAFTSNTRANTSSSKCSKIKNKKINTKENKMISNVKNAFNVIKNQVSKPKKIKENISVNNTENNTANNNENNESDINNYVVYSMNNKEMKILENNDENYNIDEISRTNKNLLASFNKEKNENNRTQSKKRKESVEVLNTEEENGGEDNLNNIDSDKERVNNNEQNQAQKENDSNEEGEKHTTKNVYIKNNNISKIAKTVVNRKNKNLSISERASCKKNLTYIEKGVKNKEDNIKIPLKKEEAKNNNNNESTFNPSLIKQKDNEFYNQEIIKNYKKYKEEKFKDLKEKQEIEFKKIYTFRPVINKNQYNNSQKVFYDKINTDFNEECKDNNFKKRCKSTTRFEKLYNDRINYQENQNKLLEQIEKEFSYKPKINKKSSYVMQKISFSERLKLYSNKTKEKINKIQENLEKIRKINESFKPKLNLNKNKELLKERNDINVIGNNKYEMYNKQYLYRQKYDKKKQYLTEKYYEEKYKSPECCPMTNNIFNHKKEKSFKKLFKILDGDNDGKISYNCMRVKKLPLNVKKILEPIFVELKNENEVLNESEFIFVCDKYYNTLKYDQKRKLILFEDEEKKKEKKEKIMKEKLNYSFRPKINKYSYSNYSYEKNINRISSTEKNKINENRIKNIDIKGINYIFCNSGYARQFSSINSINNSKMKEDKKISEEKIKFKNNIIQSISFKIDDKANSNQTDNKNSISKENVLFAQNLKNKFDRQINYKDYKKSNIKIDKEIDLKLISNANSNSNRDCPTSKSNN